MAIALDNIGREINTVNMTLGEIKGLVGSLMKEKVGTARPVDKTDSNPVGNNQEHLGKIHDLLETFAKDYNTEVKEQKGFLQTIIDTLKDFGVKREEKRAEPKDKNAKQKPSKEERAIANSSDKLAKEFHKTLGTKGSGWVHDPYCEKILGQIYAIMSHNMSSGAVEKSILAGIRGDKEIAKNKRSGGNKKTDESVGSKEKTSSTNNKESTRVIGRWARKGQKEDLDDLYFMQNVISNMSQSLDRMQTNLLGFNGFTKIIKGISDEERQFTQDVRATAYEIAGVTKESRGLQEIYEKIGESTKETGMDRSETQKFYLKALKSGIKSEKTALSIIKSQLNTEQQIGVAAGTLNDTFISLHQAGHLSNLQLEEMGRNMQSIAKSTGMTGESLVGAMKSSEQITDSFRKSGRLTTEILKNMTEMSANAKLEGVEETIAEDLKAMSSGYSMLTASGEQLTWLSQIAGNVGLQGELRTGQILQDEKNYAKLAKGAAMTLQRFVNIPEELLTNAKELRKFISKLPPALQDSMNTAIMNENKGKRGLGDVLGAVAAYERKKDFGGKISDIAKKKKEPGADLANLAEQERTLKADKNLQILNAFQEVAEGAESMEQAFSKFGEDGKTKFSKDVETMGKKWTGGKDVIRQSLENSLNELNIGRKNVGQEVVKIDLDSAMKDNASFVSTLDKLSQMQRELATSQKTSLDPVTEGLHTLLEANDKARTFTQKMFSSAFNSILGKLIVISGILTSIAVGIGFIGMNMLNQGKSIMNLADGITGGGLSKMFGFGKQSVAKKSAMDMSKLSVKKSAMDMSKLYELGKITPKISTTEISTTEISTLQKLKSVIGEFFNSINTGFKKLKNKASDVIGSIFDIKKFKKVISANIEGGQSVLFGKIATETSEETSGLFGKLIERLDKTLWEKPLKSSEQIKTQKNRIAEKFARRSDFKSLSPKEQSVQIKRLKNRGSVSEKLFGGKGITRFGQKDVKGIVSEPLKKMFSSIGRGFDTLKKSVSKDGVVRNAISPKNIKEGFAQILFGKEIHGPIQAGKASRQGGIIGGLKTARETTGKGFNAAKESVGRGFGAVKKSVGKGGSVRNAVGQGGKAISKSSEFFGWKGLAKTKESWGSAAKYISHGSSGKAGIMGGLKAVAPGLKAGKAGIMGTLGKVPGVSIGIGAVVGALSGFMNTTDHFKDVVGNANSGMKEFNTSMTVSSTVGGALWGAIDGFLLGIPGLVLMLLGCGDSVEKFFVFVTHTFTTFAEGLWDGLKYGFSFFAPYLAQTWEKVKTQFAEIGKSFGEIGTMLLGVWNSVMQYFGGSEAKNMEEMFISIWKIVKPIGQVIGTIVGYFAGAVFLTAFEALSFALSIVVGVVKAVVGIVQAFIGVLRLLWGYVKLVASPFAILGMAILRLWDVFNGMSWSDAFKNLGSDILSYLGSALGDVFSGIYDIVGGLFGAAYNLIATPIKWIVDGVIGCFTLLYDVLVGHSIIPDLVNGIIDWFSKLPGRIFSFLLSIPKMIGSILSNVGSYFEKLGDSTGFFGGMISQVGNIIGFIGKVISNLSTIISGYADVLVGIFTFDGDKIFKGVGKIWDGLSGIVTDVFSFLYKSIVNNLTNLLNLGWLAVAISNGFSIVLSVIGSYFDSFGETTGILGPIFAQLGNIFGFVGKVIGHLSTALGGVIDIITGIFTLDGSKILDGLGKIWSGLSGIVSDGFKFIKKSFVNSAKMLWKLVKTSLWTMFVGIPALIVSALSGLMNLGSWLGGWVLTGLMYLGKKVINFFYELPGKMWAGFKSIGSMLVDGVKTAFTTVGGFIKDSICKVGDYLYTSFTEALGSAWIWFEDFYKNPHKKVEKAITSVTGQLTSDEQHKKNEAVAASRNVTMEESAKNNAKKVADNPNKDLESKIKELITKEKNYRDLAEVQKREAASIQSQYDKESNTWSSTLGLNSGYLKELQMSQTQSLDNQSGYQRQASATLQQRRDLEATKPQVTMPNETDKVTADAAKTLTEHAVEKNSIYTHDTHCEKLLFSIDTNMQILTNLFGGNPTKIQNPIPEFDMTKIYSKFVPNEQNNAKSTTEVAQDRLTSKMENQRFNANQLNDLPNPREKDIFGQVKEWFPHARGDFGKSEHLIGIQGTYNNDKGKQYDRFGNPAGGTYNSTGTNWMAKDADKYLPQVTIPNKTDKVTVEKNSITQILTNLFGGNPTKIQNPIPEFDMTKMAIKLISSQDIIQVGLDQIYSKLVPNEQTNWEEKRLIPEPTKAASVLLPSLPDIGREMAQRTAETQTQKTEVISPELGELTEEASEQTLLLERMVALFEQFVDLAKPKSSINQSGGGMPGDTATRKASHSPSNYWRSPIGHVTQTPAKAALNLGMQNI